MRYWVFDLDGTICNTDNKEYIEAKPNKKMIKLVNSLYNKGDYITIYTARGSGSGINWYDLTYDQLKRWKVKYNKLLLGKPRGDIYVDDRSIKPEEFMEMMR